MRIIHQKLDLSNISYPVEQIAPLQNILFFDIETTGFTAKNSFIYLIGCAFFDGMSFRLTQWFAEKYEEEQKVIESFFKMAKNYTHIVHFNGNNFDIPFIQQKCKAYDLPYTFDDLTGIDLYRRIVPYKYFLKMPNCKQKSVELFLGFNRKDTYNGGNLINVYHDYVKGSSDAAFHLLLLHNADDIRGLIQIFPVLAYYDMFNRPLRAKKVQANTYTDYFGMERQELLLKVALPAALPAPIRFHANSCYFNGEGKYATFRIPIYQEEMKYFYASYKDYYYFADEDMAVHKSVSSYANKEYRTQATAENCYTRKFSSYLPEWDVLVQPFFKRDYKSKEIFFELTDEIKTSRDTFSRYAEHILRMMADSY
ncbi:MAG: ribonuclease H-like domain-containing protein [Lachnospiraceae bacterium]|nr:ribonuclease H-like domain-containing protein [Lachnospiraceae bacterium]